MKFFLPLQLCLLTLGLTGCAGVGKSMPLTIRWNTSNKDEASESTADEAKEDLAAKQVGQLTDAEKFEIVRDVISGPSDPKLLELQRRLAAGEKPSAEPPKSGKGVSHALSDSPDSQQAPVAQVNHVEPVKESAPSPDQAAPKSDAPPRLPTKQPNASLKSDSATAPAETQASTSSDEKPVVQTAATNNNVTSPPENTPEATNNSAVAETPATQTPDSTTNPSNTATNTETPAASAKQEENSQDIQTAATANSNEAVPTTTPQTQAAPGEWKRQLASLIRSLEARRNAVADGKNPLEQEQLETTLALLYLVANDRESALESIDLTQSEKEAFWKELVFAISVLLERDELDVDAAFFTGDHRRAAIALDHLRKAQIGLSPHASLQVKNVALCEEVTGFGNYKPFATRSFDPGQQLIVYCELANYLAEQVTGERGSGQQYESEFRSSISIVNEKKQVVKQIDYQPIVDRGRNRRQDFYVHYTLELPGELPKGNYFIALQVEDVKAGKSSSSPPVEFRVR